VSEHRYDIATPQSFWYHYGPQGETRQLTNASGVVTDNYLFSAYGSPKLSAGSAPDPNPFGYGGSAGYYTDPNMAGLILCGQRWYAPAYERWLSRDPEGYDGGANLYEYCGGNPVRAVDPSGYAPGRSSGVSGGGRLPNGGNPTPSPGPAFLRGNPAPAVGPNAELMPTPGAAKPAGIGDLDELSDESNAYHYMQSETPCSSRTMDPTGASQSYLGGTPPPGCTMLPVTKGNLPTPTTPAKDAQNLFHSVTQAIHNLFNNNRGPIISAGSYLLTHDGIY